jgi:hypothetical protein
MRRRAPFFLYLIAIVTLGSSVASIGWVHTWSSVFVPASYPSFGDMRVIQGAVISVERGLDPRISNPGDPSGRLFNYPMLWVTMGKALKITNESRFYVISTTLIFAFTGICAFLLFRFPSFSLLASVLSTATLLGIERGNIDLVIFCLLFPAALWLPKPWSPIPLLLGTVLKLYPVFALGVFFIKRQFSHFVVSVVAAAAIFAYLSDQLAGIRSTTPVNCGLSYGIPSIEECFLYLKLPFWALAVALSATAIATIVLAHRFSKSNAVNPQDGAALNLMLVGSSIYVGTFALSSNADYRLIFLIFCIPFLQSHPFPFARAFIAVILVAMNQLLITHWLIGEVMLVWLAKVAIFIVLGAYLLALAWTALATLYVRANGPQLLHQLTINTRRANRDFTSDEKGEETHEPF